MARAGDGAGARRRQRIDADQGRADRADAAGLRSGAGQRRPEWLLPHAVRAGRLQDAGRQLRQAADHRPARADGRHLVAGTGRTASGFLDLVQATPADAAPQVWGKVAEVFNSIDQFYSGQPERRQRFDAYAIARLSPVLARIGWSAAAGEADPVATLRNHLIATLGTLGDPTVIAEARRRYAAQSSDASAMPGAIRLTVLGVVARQADSATWDQLRASAQAEKSALVKTELYDLLAAPSDAALAQRALELALTDEPGATNSPALIVHVAQQHPDLAFDFALAHLEQVNQKVDSPSRSRYFPRLGAQSADPAMLDKLQAYADAHLAKGSRRDTDTAIAGIKYRIKVRGERLPEIDAWLANNKQ